MGAAVCDWGLGGLQIREGTEWGGAGPRGRLWGGALSGGGWRIWKDLPRLIYRQLDKRGSLLLRLSPHKTAGI